tara:strand:+ start:138 stop:464 length:327 start_codon:yes stop_codon:yes gene_type:complete
MVNTGKQYLIKLVKIQKKVSVINLPIEKVAVKGFVTKQTVAVDTASALSGSDGSGRDSNGKLTNTEFKNSGAELRYNAMKLIYNKSVTNTVLMSVGVIASLYFIAKTE